MERKQFLKSSLAFLGLATIAPLAQSCSKEDVLSNTADTGTVTGTGSTSDACATTPSETAGPFPTKTPSSLVTNNIISDRSGVSLSINITVNNNNNNCAALAS